MPKCSRTNTVKYSDMASKATSRFGRLSADISSRNLPARGSSEIRNKQARLFCWHQLTSTFVKALGDCGTGADSVNYYEIVGHSCVTMGTRLAWFRTTTICLQHKLSAQPLGSADAILARHSFVVNPRLVHLSVGVVCVGRTAWRTSTFDNERY